VLAIQAASICTVEAKAFGYDSTIGHIPVQSSSGLFTLDPLTIQRSDRGAVPQERTAKTVSATSLKAPANAVKLFDHGAQSLQKRKFTDAAKDFESAIKLYPDYAEAWLNLGRARVSLDSLVPAREAFRRAAELDPQMAGPPAELGLLAARQGDVASAARYLDESLRLDPAGSFQTCYSDALVNFVLKRYEVAESSARAALRFGETPAQARADYILGMALLALGSNDEARQRLVRYLELAPKAPERDQVMKELSRLDQIGAGAR
jgi:tetratricopeptide (TPR) repeat protein